jgi:hypothetical protein
VLSTPSTLATTSLTTGASLHLSGSASLAKGNSGNSRKFQIFRHGNSLLCRLREIVSSLAVGLHGPAARAIVDVSASVFRRFYSPSSPDRARVPKAPYKLFPTERQRSRGAQQPSALALPKLSRKVPSDFIGTGDGLGAIVV